MAAVATATTTAAAEPIIHNLSTTTIRAPYSTSAAPSMADTLPNLNFGFDDLRARMSSFTQRFDEFIERGRRRVLEERNQFRMNIAETHDEQKQAQKSIEKLESKSQQHALTLEGQSAEMKEMHEQIRSLEERRDGHADEVKKLRQRLGKTKGEIGERKGRSRAHQQYLARQASFNGPEIDFWEGYLGLRIEGTGKEDRIRFVFTGCDKKNSLREAWFELDMSGNAPYEIVTSEPRLEASKAEKCLAKMTESEDLAGFLKGMRELFVHELG